MKDLVDKWTSRTIRREQLRLRRRRLFWKQLMVCPQHPNPNSNKLKKKSRFLSLYYIRIDTQTQQNMN
jgi:hypothetical protein